MELPPLGDRVEPDALRELSDDGLDALGAELQATERATIAAMAPYEQHLREIRTRATELATERRRRERAQQVAQRAGRPRGGEVRWDAEPRRGARESGRTLRPPQPL